MTTETPNLKKAFSANPNIGTKLQGYYLMRAYHKDAPPFATVSDLPDSEAIALCEEKEPTRGLTSMDTEGTRDQSAYMQKRQQTEDWLRNNARASGTRIDKQNPVYFAFTREPERFREHMAAKPGMELYESPAADVDLSNWSFTMNDHFFADLDNGDKSVKTLKDYPPHPLHGKVLNAAQLLAAIEEYGYPEDEMVHNFEAQMWADAPTLLPSANTAAPTTESAIAPNRNPEI